MPEPAPAADDGRRFHPWRLLGVLAIVIAVVALISAAIDLAVRG